MSREFWKEGEERIQDTEKGRRRAEDGKFEYRILNKEF